MVVKATKYKTSKELMDIAVEMLAVLVKKHKPTCAEIAMIIALMDDSQQYANEAEHIERLSRGLVTFRDKEF